jgi:hypothetical protein
MHSTSNFLKVSLVPNKGCQIFWCIIPKRGKICQLTKKFTKRPQLMPNGRKTFLMEIQFTKVSIYSFYKKNTQIVILDVKICRLATLSQSRRVST